jgi:hypothetical protein
MSTPSDQDVPGTQEPAEGSRETVEGSLQDQDQEPRSDVDIDADQGVSEYVPDA